MKKIYYTLLLLAVVLTGCKEDRYEVTFRQDVLSETAVLRGYLETFAATAKQSADVKSLQEDFIKCRLQYKKTEWAVEYFVPDIAKGINCSIYYCTC